MPKNTSTKLVLVFTLLFLNCAACKPTIRTEQPGLSRVCAVAEFCMRVSGDASCGPAIISCSRLSVTEDCNKDERCILSNR